VNFLRGRSTDQNALNRSTGTRAPDPPPPKGEKGGPDKTKLINFD